LVNIDDRAQEPGVSDDERGVERLAMVAAAVAGRALVVAPTEPGEPAWTDGKTIYGTSQVTIL